jgi:sugar/nucleoside kinase (ribokinase family)
MIQVLGDLIADISMRLPHFPVQAKDIHRLSYLEVGPGGACNIAIMAARFGLSVGGLGEVGDDGFGLVVREGLKREGVDISRLIVTEGAKTPVAGVVVDRAGEPAYLGHPGSLVVDELPTEWIADIKKAEALFADGWVENEASPLMILKGFDLAREAKVPVFFDPGPGNPDVDNAWMQEALKRSTVVMLNRREAKRLTEQRTEDGMLKSILDMGVEVLVLKRGADGLILAQGETRYFSHGFKVQSKDATGAGDSLAGAMLYGMTSGMDLEKLSVLANATGAAKVQKLGTGHNMPTMEEVAAVLRENGHSPGDYLPG